MADSLPPRPGPGLASGADEILSRLPVDLRTLPERVRNSLEERARSVDRRLVIGRYLVTGELGRGGMGVVFEAWDPGIERRVAIKTMDPDLVPEDERAEVVERFRREIKIVGRLHHPGIVTIYDYGEEREPPPVGGGVGGSKLLYYVMEHLEGVSLSRLLRERRVLPEAQSLKIIADVLEALDVSHRAGVIHRDIKPSNIFLRNATQAVILDFGIAKTTSVALTRQGQILGTPSFLAPERLREKEHPVDGRADIFSLGVLLFTMLVGEPPFVGQDVYDLIEKITSTAHKKLPGTTPGAAALSTVIDRMLAKRPEERYATAGEAATALLDVLARLERTTLEAVTVAHRAATDPSGEAHPTEVARAYPQGGIERGPAPARLDSGLERAVDQLEAARQTTPAPSLTRTPSDADLGPETPAPIETIVTVSPERLSVARSSPGAELRTSYGPAEETLESMPALPHGASASDEHALAGIEEEATDAGQRSRGSKPSVSQDAAQRAPALDASARRDDRETDEMRIAGGEGEGGGTISDGPESQPGLSSGRSKRIRIEASLVDEAEVIVRPTASSELGPENVPTRTELSTLPRVLRDDSDHLAADSRRDLERARGKFSDPAEPRAQPRGASAAPRSPSGLRGGEPRTSATVARHTFDARADRRKAKPSSLVHRVGSAIGGERGQLVRRRAMVLVMAMLGATAVGLFLSRARVTPVDVFEMGQMPEPIAPPRAERTKSMPESGVDTRAEPPAPSELFDEASAALAEGQFGNAEALFLRALSSTPETWSLRAQALLGRADALRQLGDKTQAIQVYRGLLNEFPKGSEADNARVALKELGTSLAPKGVEKSRVVGGEGNSGSEHAVVERPGATPPAEAPDHSPLSVEERCQRVVRDHLNDPEKEVDALSAMVKADQRVPCVYLALGRAYIKLKNDRAALVAFRRYLELKPGAENRAAVEDRIRSLAAKLEER